jgi:hypothetical protein
MEFGCVPSARSYGFNPFVTNLIVKITKNIHYISGISCTFRGVSCDKISKTDVDQNNATAVPHLLLGNITHQPSVIYGMQQGGLVYELITLGSAFI